MSDHFSSSSTSPSERWLGSWDADTYDGSEPNLADPVGWSPRAVACPNCHVRSGQDCIASLTDLEREPGFRWHRPRRTRYMSQLQNREFLVRLDEHLETPFCSLSEGDTLHCIANFPSLNTLRVLQRVDDGWEPNCNIPRAVTTLIGLVPISRCM